MDSIPAIVANASLYLAFSGAVLRYLVWAFWGKPEQLQVAHGGNVRDATERISAEQFMPSVVNVIETLDYRRRLSADLHPSVVELLSEVDVAARLRDVKRAAEKEQLVLEGFARFQDSCSWVSCAGLTLWLTGSLLWSILLFMGCHLEILF